MQAFAPRRAADRIDRDQRADAKAARGHGARRAQAPLEIVGGRAKSGAGGAELKLAGGGRRGGEAHLPIGGFAAPCLVAAVEEIEQARTRHDRNPRAAMLEKAAGSGAASRVEPTIRSLQGDGYAQMGKLGEAAKQYQAAAAATPFALEKAYFQAKAARAFQAAGDTAQARQLWTALAEDPTSSAVSEARVRLGELTAAPAKP